MWLPLDSQQRPLLSTCISKIIVMLEVKVQMGHMGGEGRGVAGARAEQMKVRDIFYVTTLEQELKLMIVS